MMTSLAFSLYKKYQVKDSKKNYYIYGFLKPETSSNTCDHLMKYY